MPSVTLHPAADVATTSSGLGAGAGPHLPIGSWSGTRYRSAVRFTPPSGWASWTAITKATLSFNISDHSHVGPKGSTILIRRQSQASLWTKGQGGQNCNGGFSGSNNTQYDDITPSTSGEVSFSSGSTANARKTVTVTGHVQSYWGFPGNVLVFVFDQDSSSDYTELWSQDADSKYEMDLVIDYEVASPPSPPTLLTPAAGATGVPRLPTFTWNHVDPQGDPQNAAEVRIYDDVGTTLLYTLPVTGAGESVTATVPLAAGTMYTWAARTSDAVSGYGALTSRRSFFTAALPSVTVAAARHMVFANGAPRLVVDWAVANGVSNTYIVTAPGYTSGSIPGVGGSWVLDTLNLTNGTPVTVTVQVTFADGQSATDSKTFTPRWGLTVHRRDLLAPPSDWQSANVASTIPAGADLKVQYGSNTSAAAAPTAWFDDLASVPLAQWVYWRAWFIPSATAGPTLDKVTIISTTGAAQGLDQWSTSKAGPALAPPWAVDTGEYVYGTRSVRASVSGAGPFYLYSQPILLRANRTYILTGLMKSQGNSGARLELQNAAGTVLASTTALVADALFYDPVLHDVIRYKTLAYQVGGADVTVYAVCKAGGTSGAKAWFDAIKVEESTVNSPWHPAALGGAIIDGSGVQVDGSKGGVLRYKGIDNGVRSVVRGWTSGLEFGGDTELTSPADGILAVDGIALMRAGDNIAALGGNKPWRFVSLVGNGNWISAIPDSTVVTVAHTVDQVTAEMTALPIGVVAVYGHGIWRGDSTQNREFNVVHWSGMQALQLYNQVVNVNQTGTFICTTGGTNGRQMKWRANSVAGNMTCFIRITGYWITD